MVHLRGPFAEGCGNSPGVKLPCVRGPGQSADTLNSVPATSLFVDTFRGFIRVTYHLHRARSGYDLEPNDACQAKEGPVLISSSLPGGEGLRGGYKLRGWLLCKQPTGWWPSFTRVLLKKASRHRLVVSERADGRACGGWSVFCWL